MTLSGNAIQWKDLYSICQPYRSVGYSIIKMFIPKKTPDQLNCTTAIESNGNFTKVIGQDNKESLFARPQFSFQYDNIDIYITLTPAKRNWK